MEGNLNERMDSYDGRANKTHSAILRNHYVPFNVLKARIRESNRARGIRFG